MVGDGRLARVARCFALIPAECPIFASPRQTASGISNLLSRLFVDLLFGNKVNSTIDP